MYKGVGVRFADFISFFLKNENKQFGFTKTIVFHFHRIFN